MNGAILSFGIVVLFFIFSLTKRDFNQISVWGYRRCCILVLSELL